MKILAAIMLVDLQQILTHSPGSFSCQNGFKGGRIFNSADKAALRLNVVHKSVVLCVHNVTKYDVPFEPMKSDLFESEQMSFGSGRPL